MWDISVSRHSKVMRAVVGTPVPVAGTGTACPLLSPPLRRRDMNSVQENGAPQQQARPRHPPRSATMGGGFRRQHGNMQMQNGFLPGMMTEERLGGGGGRSREQIREDSEGEMEMAAAMEWEGRAGWGGQFAEDARMKG